MNCICCEKGKDKTVLVTANFWSRSGSLFVTENFWSRSDSLRNLRGVIWTILAYLRTLQSKARVNRATKTSNMFCSIATKRLEKRCCTFYHQRSNLFCKQQQMSLLQVAWILTSNWVKLSGSRAIQVNYVTYCKTSLRWAGKTRNMYWFRCNKIELLSTFCNPFPQPVTNWFVAR